MCIQNTYSCPTCQSTRTETYPCRRGSTSTPPSTASSLVNHSRKQLQNLHLSPNYTPPSFSPSSSSSSSPSPSPTTTNGRTYTYTPYCDSLTRQNLLATCQSCTARYRLAYEQTLRRSIAMSRCGSSSSSRSSYSTQEADVDMLNIPQQQQHHHHQEDMTMVVDGEDPHERLLESERRKGEMVWGNYERMERERLCKRMEVGEDEILFA